MSLKSIIEESDSGAGRLFDLFIQFLIVVSIVSFTIETLPDLGDDTRRLLRRVEIVVVLVFTLEYLLRIVVADNRLSFVFSFFGMIDLLAILPFYIATGVDLRSLRIFRLLRIFRAFKLIRFSQAAQRFSVAFKSIRAELTLFFLASLFLLYVSAVGIYHFEHPAQPEQFRSVIDSMWWSVTSLTTVGYGDMYPVTTGGKIFTFFVLMVGLGLVAVPSGLIASALTSMPTDDED